jgi:adenylate cyclase
MPESHESGDLSYPRDLYSVTDTSSGPADRADSEAALDRIIEVVLGAPAELTAEEVAALAGLTTEQARPYWRAMGFPDTEDRVFTRLDAQALKKLADWVRDGQLDEATTIEVMRGLGQTTSRLAGWQSEVAARVVAELPAPTGPDEVQQGLAGMMPGLEMLLVHSWRRHLAAVVGRGLVAVDGPEATDDVPATVCFADVAGFTRLTRVLTDSELTSLVEGFETGAADLVAAHGGRLVKTLGDEVMFISPDPDAAVAIATGLHDVIGLISAEARLRIGVATGPVIPRMGDVYGSTVNRASRLTAIARPGSTLIDPQTEDALTDPKRYLLRHQRPRPLRGLGLVRATSVSRREP